MDEQSARKSSLASSNKASSRVGKDHSGKRKKVRLPVVQRADYRGKAAEKIEKGYTKATALLGGAVTREVALVGSMFLEQGKTLSCTD